jgi:sulfatase modifying factor 1
VSWENAVDYTKWLSAREGKTYRLPTEAEWEYAAKGGQKSKGYNYAGSDDLDAVAWYRKEESRCIAEVGQKQANELGLYDMSGNVWEWCSDWFDTFPYDNSSTQNPQGPNDGEFRVLRGGSWDSSARFCRTIFRNGYEPWNRGKNVEFRLVLEFD